MKIKVEKWIVNEDAYNYQEIYKIKSIEKCCNKILHSKNIDINNEYCEDDVYEDDNKYGVKLVRHEEETFSWEDWTDTSYYYESISHCPFCGKKIDIEIISAIDKTEEYSQLTKEREVLWNKYRRTDSIKKQEILKEQLNELDEKINNILENDSFNCSFEIIRSED